MYSKLLRALSLLLAVLMLAFMVVSCDLEALLDDMEFEELEGLTTEVISDTEGPDKQEPKPTNKETEKEKEGYTSCETTKQY